MRVLTEGQYFDAAEPGLGVRVPVGHQDAL